MGVRNAEFGVRSAKGNADGVWFWCLVLLALAPSAAYAVAGWTDDSTIVRLDTSSDKVGVGTAVPSYKFQVEVNADVLSCFKRATTTNGYAVIQINNTSSGGSHNVQFGSKASSTLASSYAYFSADSTTEHLVIKRNGNVGIGETGPARALVVKRASGTETSLQLLQGTTTWVMAIPGGETDLRFWNGTSDVLTIKNNGNIGVGAAPVNKLDVAGKMVIGSSYAGSNTAPSDGLLVQGNVAIGKTYPYEKLDVGGNISSDGVLKVDTLLFKVGAATIPLWSDGGSIHFSYGNAMVFDGWDLSVAQGISAGTSVSSNTVTADTGYFEKIVVNSDWVLEAPDYVFAPSFKVKPLKEVEAYVKKNRHLEGMPSAKEFKTKGVDLAQMNMALLKQVELLVLQNIAQEKRIESLEKKLAQK